MAGVVLIVCALAVSFGLGGLFAAWVLWPEDEEVQR